MISGEKLEMPTTETKKEKKVITYNSEITKKNSVIAISSAAAGIIASIKTAVATAAASASVPAVGWVIAAAAIATVVIIVVVNYKTIEPYLEQLKTELVIKFAKIQKLINSTFAKGIDQGRESYFNSAVDDALNSAKEKGGNRTWNNDQLKDALGKALNSGTKKGGLSLLTFAALSDYFKRKKKLVVFLGRFRGPNKNDCSKDSNKLPTYQYGFTDYRAQSIGKFNWTNEIAIVYSMHTDIWNYYEGHHDDMWVVNLFFVELMAALDCDFILIDRPIEYYEKATKRLVQSDVSYSKELRAIDLLGYNWNEHIMFSRATRNSVIA